MHAGSVCPQVAAARSQAALVRLALSARLQVPGLIVHGGAGCARGWVQAKRQGMGGDGLLVRDGRAKSNGFIVSAGARGKIFGVGRGNQVMLEKNGYGDND